MVKGYADSVGKPWQVLLDPERKVYGKFSEKGVPAFVIIDRDRKLRYRERGWWASSAQGADNLAFEIQKAMIGT